MSKPTDYQISFQVSFSEFGLLDACINATKFYILRKNQVTDQPFSEMERDLLSKIDDLRLVMKNYAISSTNNLPVQTLREELTKATNINEVVIAAIENVDAAILGDLKEKIAKARNR